MPDPASHWLSPWAGGPSGDEIAGNGDGPQTLSPVFVMVKPELRWLLVALLWFGGGLFAANASAGDVDPADAWFTNQVVLPSDAGAPALAPGTFSSLHAAWMLGRYLLYSWTPERMDPSGNATLVVSAGEPGHWPARDWKAFPMVLSGNAWTARPPLPSLRAPVFYYVRSVSGGQTNRSPLRMVRPDAAGLTGPLRPFSPFLEGFEQGVANWCLVLDHNDNSRRPTDALARSGYHSLRVSLAPGQHSVTVATTLVRGWQLEESGATGISLWLRTKVGSGRARFTLHANALTADQVAVSSSLVAEVGDHWMKVVIPIESFPGLPLRDVDWFAVEFIGATVTDFLLDDLELVGPWPGAEN